MKFKRITAIFLAAASAVSLCACKAKDPNDYKNVGKGGYSEEAYDYDLSKYITLGEYKGVKYTPADTAVTEKDITDAIHSAMESASLTTKEDAGDQPAELGDTVNIDFEGLLDGVAFQGGTAMSYDLTLGSGKFIDGFEDGLVGVKKGESVSLNLKFPENYGKADLNGKAVVFNVTVNSVTKTIYPELTNENVSKISSYDNVDAYKAYLQTSVADTKKAQAENKKLSDVWGAIVASTEMKSYPDAEYQKYYTQFVTTYTNYAQSYGMEFSQFLSTYLGMTETEFYETAKEMSEQGIKEEMIAFEIARKENVDYTVDEFSAKIKSYAEEKGYESEDELINQIGLDRVVAAAIIEKVQSYVIENAVAE